MIRLSAACVIVALIAQPVAAAPPRAGNEVPAHSPANPSVAAHEQTTAKQLLKRDSQVRGRIVHQHGYASRQQSAIHQEREQYLRSKADARP